MARLAIGLAAIMGPCVLEDEDMDCGLDVDSDTDGEPLGEPGPYICVESQRNEVIGEFPFLDT